MAEEKTEDVVKKFSELKEELSISLIKTPVHTNLKFFTDIFVITFKTLQSALL